VQANFVAMPSGPAKEFLEFCKNNSKPCPLLDVTKPGDPIPSRVAPDADLRSDIPKYCVYRDGVLVEEVADITEYWTDDMVGFLLGCSFSWESALEEAGLCPRHVEEGRNVPMYRTAIENDQAGQFKGNLVVSMRPYSPDGAAKVAAITELYPGAHGGPVQIGLDADNQASGTRLGIKQSDLSTPNWGDSVTIRDGEVPVFWACGVTPQTGTCFRGCVDVVLM
jgi:uncharacterized protein YcsI (UPF0317 family)